MSQITQKEKNAKYSPNDKKQKTYTVIIPSTTLIHTDHGVLYPSEITTNMKMLCNMDTCQVIGNVNEEPIAKPLSISTSIGPLKCFSSVVPVWNYSRASYNWKNTNNISHNDRLVLIKSSKISSSFHVPYNVTHMKTYTTTESKKNPISEQKNNKVKKYFITDINESEYTKVELTIHTAYFLGYVHGLSYSTILTTDTVHFKRNDPVLHQYIKYFKFQLSPGDTIKSKQLYNNIQSFKITGCIPKYIRGGDYDIKKAYTTGFSCAKGQTPQGTITGVMHTTTIMELQALFASIGIRSVADTLNKQIKILDIDYFGKSVLEFFTPDIIEEPVKINNNCEINNPVNVWKLTIYGSHPIIVNGGILIGGIPSVRDTKEENKTRNPSLKGDTLILTRDGIVPIKQLKDTYFEVKNAHGNWERATCVLSGKNATLYKLTLYNNKTYYTTEEHMWPIVNTPPKQSKPKTGAFYDTVSGQIRSNNDLLADKRALEQKSKEQKEQKKDNNITQYKETTKLKKVKTSQLKDGDLVVCLRFKELGMGKGFTFTDGFCVGLLYGSKWNIVSEVNDKKQTQYYWTFPLDSQECNSQGIVSMWLNNIGVESKHYKKCDDLNHTDNTVVFKVTSPKLDSHLEKIGVPSLVGNDFDLPKAIWNGSDKFRDGFVDGLYSSSGAVNVNNHLCTIVSRSKKMIDSLFNLLGFYGLHVSTISEQSDKKENPIEPIKHTLYIHMNNFFTQFSITLPAFRKIIDKMNLPPYKEVLYDACRIKSIERTTLKDDVYDITVYDDSHCFLLSHCLTGNCHEEEVVMGKTKELP